MRRIVTACVLSGCVVATVSAQAIPGAASKKPAAEKPVWPDEGPRTWTPRPTSPEISANDLRTRLYQFADDSMQGRRIGEPGNFKGTAYIASEFRRMGLTPAGDSGTYFQELAFGPIGYDSAASRLSAGGTPLSPRTDWVPIIPSGLNRLSGAASLTDAATLFAGRWGDTSVALDAARYRGKVAVFLSTPAAPGFAALPRAPTLLRCDSVPDRFGAAAAIRLDVANSAAIAAAVAARGPVAPTVPPVRDLRALNAGAAAVLIVGLEALPATAVTAAFGARQAMQPATPANAPTMVGATISSAAAARIFGRPVEQLSVGTAGQPVSANWTYAWRRSASPARNVVAVLPGSDPARALEYVLVGAHNDHVGTIAVAVDHDSLRAVNTVTRRQGANDPTCRPTAVQQQRIDSLIAHARGIRPPRRDSIMNGADDDGSGTVVLLEIAERFATEKPARSIIFVSHQGEEAGLLGSRWFVDHPTIPLSSIVAALNMDMLGKGRVEQVKFGGPNSVQILGARRLSREFGDIIDSVNATRAEPMALDKSWDVKENPLNRFCRSDQVNYVLKDIPVTYFSLGYSLDYHQATDEPQYIDYDHAAKLGRFVHDVMWAIAVRTDRPAIAGPDPGFPICR